MRHNLDLCRVTLGHGTMNDASDGVEQHAGTTGENPRISVRHYWLVPYHDQRMLRLLASTARQIRTSDGLGIAFRRSPELHFVKRDRTWKA